MTEPTNTPTEAPETQGQLQPPPETTTEQPSAFTPEMLKSLEKFKDGESLSVEKLAKSYIELEKKLGQPRPAEAKKEPEKKPDGLTIEPPTEANLEEAVETAASAAALDINELASTFAEKGSLSDDHYAALQKVGFPKDVVDEIAGALIFKREQESNTLLTETVGGREAYASMTKWAADGGLTPDEIADFNEAVSGTNKAAVKAVLKDLKGRYEAALGSGGPQSAGPSGGAAGSSLYDESDYLAAVGDERYYSDPKYKAQVDALALASMKAGKLAPPRMTRST